jgi:predicted RNA-binding Zn-ribbon protein involved in translation (DUF1610 family)
MEEFPKLQVNHASGKLLHLCANCAEAIIAATSSQYVSERCVCNSWSCDMCGFEYKTATTFRSH